MAACTDATNKSGLMGGPAVAGSLAGAGGPVGPSTTPDSDLTLFPGRLSFDDGGPGFEPLPAQHDNPTAIAAAVELRESGRDVNHRDRILALLRDGPKTGNELAEVTRRYSARIKELRTAGHRILSVNLGGGTWLFKLLYEVQP